MFDITTILDRLIFWIPAVLAGLTFHEFAHGFVAEKLGDKTARHAGRLTLNPLPHIDPVGMLLLLVAGFGWAKPVPVNPYYFRGNRRTGMMLVSLAGPAANVVVALGAAIAISFLGPGAAIVPWLDPVIWVNLVLAFFNLLPIPPLDGSKILAGLIPGSTALLAGLERYGFLILIVLVFTGAISALLSGIIFPIYYALIRFALGF